MGTKVVHCKREKYDVHIGRERKRLHFGNPFTHRENSLADVKVDTPQDAVDNFEKWLSGKDWHNLEQERRSWILDNLRYLKNKTLGCWCKVKGNEPCHGDIYVKFINNLG